MRSKSGTQLYSLREYYWIIYYAFRSFIPLANAKKNKVLSQRFMERIMLSVTEVNGCDVCSYAHTKMALESGMSSEEIRSILAGTIDDVPENEIHGVMFGQHYAYTRAKPSVDSWEQINEVYDKKRARGILAATRIMMLGNALGIPLSSFFKRFKGKADKRSNPGYELAILLGSLIMIPIGGIHAIIAEFIKVPYVNFYKKNIDLQ